MKLILINIFLSNFKQSQVNHILQGSKKLGHTHYWNLLVKNSDWRVIRRIIVNVIMNGTYVRLGSKDAFEKEIKGFIIRVTYRIADGVFKIGNAYIQRK